MTKITQIRNPKYTKQGLIDCEILHPELGWIPFTANPSDVVDYGRDVYQRIIDGEFGEIAPYVVNIGHESSIVRGNRNRMLLETDWTQLPDVPQTTKDVWAIYRQSLRDIPQQEGFPLNVIWPNKPI